MSQGPYSLVQCIAVNIRFLLRMLMKAQEIFFSAHRYMSHVLSTLFIGHRSWSGEIEDPTFRVFSFMSSAGQGLI